MLRIAPNGGTAPNTRAGISCSLPLGTHQARNGALMQNDNEEIRSIRSHPQHPYNAFVVVACASGAIRRAELHWFEATGIGRYEFKIKRYLD